MSSTIDANGSCLCGAVKVEVKSIPTEVSACHCNMCRKWVGGIFLVVDCKDEVKFSGKENISSFNSSEWAERGFCAKCGTHLFYRLKENNQHFMPAELFDANTEFHLSHQIFIDEKPGYYAFANTTKNMTGAEVFSHFTGEQKDA